ncbi:hypothetical protein P154DRAFT_612098 [Amniculicola lignicola CBS 123094]|uniref:Uncharacterized protein n=1 Tax=Amniculicola lignicola CBS 123094 TaxID=1392246 RepID=A0A6A5W232_9PLEO|nr:hypothetical protein P154DRAFT_612098 [Amniculicola lignicola CBS 123094]
MNTILDTRLSYRIGSPILPVLPVVSRAPPQLSDAYLTVTDEEEINKILMRHQINCSWTILQRLHENAQTQDNLVTLLILSKVTEDSKLRWTTAVSEVRAYFNSMELNYAVEIIDKHADNGLATRIVDPADIDVELWNTTILPSVVEALGSQDWLSVDVLQREHPHYPESDPISLIISAQDADDPVWDTIILSLTSKLSLMVMD